MTKKDWLYDVLNTILEVTDVAPLGRGVRQYAQDILRRLRPTAECPACVHRRTMEDIAIQTLLKYLDDARLAAALHGASGLCLPHFSQALELTASSGLNQFQRTALAVTLEQLERSVDEIERLLDGAPVGATYVTVVISIGRQAYALRTPRICQGCDSPGGCAGCILVLVRF